MYSLINQHAEYLVTECLAKENHVSEYCWLLEQLRETNVIEDGEFQRRYIAFWSMNAIRPSKEFKSAYFTCLEKHKHRDPDSDVKTVATELYRIPATSNGKQTLQFSFASKLVHMISPQKPVYDSMVERFYFLPSTTATGLDRLPLMMKSYDFLANEYRRVIDSRLLHRSVDVFRDRFPNPKLTNEKIIDSLIWSFVSRLKSGAIRDKLVTYI